MTRPGCAALAAGPTCCHQDAALGVHNPLTQGLWGETCKLEKGKKQDTELKKRNLLCFHLSVIVSQYYHWNLWTLATWTKTEDNKSATLSTSYLSTTMLLLILDYTGKLWAHNCSNNILVLLEMQKHEMNFFFLFKWLTADCHMQF